MAKTSKTTKRPTASSGKKKGILGRSFNLKSRKVQFVVAILIVAILGGGYFTYKSFAATKIYTYTPAYGNLTTNASTANCSANRSSEPSKNNTAIFVIGCNGRNLYGEAKISTSGAYITQAIVNTQWRACFMVKGAGYGTSPGNTLGSNWVDGTIRITESGDSVAVAGLPADQLNLIKRDSYTQVCTGYTRVIRKPGPIDATLTLKNNAAGILAATQITLESVDVAPAPATVAPQSSKGNL